jgi:WD40 repeat protein/mono/diheme cytochrome c family protein
MKERRRLILYRSAYCRLLLALAAMMATVAGVAGRPAAAASPVSYQKQVQPILQRRCQGCHQPANRSGKLAVTSYPFLKTGGDHGPGFIPGKPSESVLVRYIGGKEPLMPKGGPPMPAAEVALIQRWIAEGAKDDTIAAKDPIDAAHPPSYAAPPVISALAYSPDGSTLAVAGYREVLLHKADGSGLIGRLVGASDRIETLAYSPDGKLLAAVGGAPARFGEVQFWDPATRQLLRAVQATYDTLFGASISPDGKMLAFGCADNTARIVTVPEGKQILKFENHSDWVFATAFSRDNKNLITASRDRAMKLVLIEGDSGSFVDDINKHYEGLKCVARHPKEEQIVCAGFDGIPRLYRIFREKARTMMDEDHNLIREFERQPGPVNALAFSPDGTRLAVAGVGGEAHVYDVKEGKKVATLKGHEGAIFALAYSPKGDLIATGGFDGRVRLFNAATGALVKAFVPVPMSPKVTSAKKVATSSH